MDQIDIESLDTTRLKDPRSKLMQARAAARKGAKIRICPFGCKENQLDENSYCRHVVGLTLDGKTYEPMIRKTGGRRAVQVPMVASGDFEMNDEGQLEPIMVPDPPKCLKTDKFCRVSIWHLVYRSDEEQARLKAEQAEEKTPKKKAS